MTETDFSRKIRSIRERPQEDIPAIWCNMIRFRDLVFLQGQLWAEETPAGVYRPLAALVDLQDPVELNGFWPSVMARPVERNEEAWLASFLSSQDPNEVELIVPERNTARLMDWGRFDEAPEHPVYANRIHPAVIEAVEGIRNRWEARPGHPCFAYRRDAGCTSLEPLDRLLDVGCGCGDLIQELQEGIRRKEEALERCGCMALQQLRRPGLGRFLECHGIDINPDNVEEARCRGLANVRTGEGEDFAGLPGESAFDILIFCGLLNRQVTTREQSEAILHTALSRLRRSGHVIITGYTSCHLTADDLSRLGLMVLQKCFPDRLFLDYNDYHLRQFYVARKDA